MPRRRLKVTDVNPHFLCTICDGYLVDATTIIECLHSFCRTCIVRYLESSKFCPVCDVQVHKTRPLLSIRSDQTLQDLVYKMVPGLYQSEMQRRREFYAEHPEAASECPAEERGECDPRFFSPSETISIIVQHRPKDPPGPGEIADDKDPTTRYLSCPAAFTMGHLKKFIHFKFSLPPACAIDLLYEDHLLRDDDSLMDVAYIYSWKRAAPMKFQYSISKRVPKCVEPPTPPPSAVSHPAVSVAEPMEADEGVAVESVAEKDAPPKTTEPQAMEIDPEPEIDSKPEIQSKPEIIEVERTSPPPEVAKIEISESVPVPSSTNCVPKMNVVEPEVVSKPSSPEKPILKPIAEPTYNSVKLISPPGRNTVLSPTNGIRLKFTHDPGKAEPKSRSKKSGRKGARNSRHKSAPVRLARLAPYPPPPPTVAATCLTTQPLQRLSQITVGKLVPSVVPSVIAPTIVTTLVSTTATTFCNATQNSHPPQVSRGLASNHPTTVNNISSNANNFLSSVASSGSENNSLSSTSECSQLVNGLTVPSVSCPSADQGSQANTKELSKTLTVTSACAIIPAPPSLQSSVSSSSPSETVSVKSNSSKMDTTPSSISVTPVCVPAVTNGDRTPAVSYIPDKLPIVTPPGSFASKDSDGVEKLASTCVEDSPVKVVPTSDEPDSRSAFKEEAPSELDKVSSADTVVNRDETNSLSSNEKECILKIPVDEKSESFKMSVKNSISAEFSDNDDLGCQPDLIVDEQKMDSSDNEDDTDAALRKKITAIAEKDDEADVTDDTEADSGRASDMSCPARCEDDVGSPMLTDVSTPSAPAVSAAPTPTAAAPAVDNSRHIKSNNIDAVIDNLYRQHEICRPSSSTVSPKPVSPKPPQPPAPPKDDMGVLDLSKGTRKQGEGQVCRPKAVANPVLDFKHRQQTYLPAPQQHTGQHPMKQHTICPPAPAKHPTASYMMQHHLLQQQQAAAHTNSILHAQLTGNSKSHPLSYAPSSSTQFSATSRAASSPSSLSGRTTPATYGHKLSPGPAHPGAMSLASMLPYPSHPMMSNLNLASYAGRGNMALSLPRSFTSCLPKEVSTATSSASSKQTFSGHSKETSTFSSRKASDVGSPAFRASSLPSPSAIPAHPRTSPSVMRMSPHHRSASPAPSPQHATPSNSLSASSLAAATTPSHCKPSVPMYKKMDSSKSYNHKFKSSSNLVVYNKDPNGCSLVFKNLNSRQNNRH